MKELLLKLWGGYMKCTPKKKVCIAFAILVVLAGIIALVAIHWMALAGVGFLIAVAVGIIRDKLWDARERKEAEERQVQQNVSDAAYYMVEVMRRGLVGLEKHLHISDTPDKGFIGIAPFQKDNIWHYALRYRQLPNAPAEKDYSELVNALNTNIMKVLEHHVFASNIRYIPYVIQIKASDGILEIIAVLIVDRATQEYVNRHVEAMVLRKITGYSDENIAPKGALYDDEL